MNAIKTGKLICAIRTNKGLTQKQLAEQINVSDKAVSKWERGDGCPDISILPILAQVLGIEVDNILNGELPASKNNFIKNLPTRRIKQYDFCRPDKWGAEDLRAILYFFTELIPQFESLFASIRNEKCAVKISCIDQLTNDEFLPSIPYNCFLYDYNYNDAGYLMEVDPQIGKALIKQNPETFPEVTKFDLDVLQNFYILNLIDLLNSALLKKLGNLNDEQQSSVIKTFRDSKAIRSAMVQPAKQMCCLVSMEISVGETKGFLNLQLSDNFLSILRSLNFFGFNWKEPKVQYLSDVKTKKADNNLFVEFGRFNSENVQLEVGKILIFDKKFYDPLNLVYKNKVIFQGEAVVIDENFGIRIKEDSEKPNIIYEEEKYITVLLGACNHSEDEIKNIGDKTILELNTYAGYPSPIIKDGKLAGYGEIVVDDDYFGIRITELVE